MKWWFLTFHVLSSTKASFKAPSNRFGRVLGTILWPFWSPKSIIEASLMASKVVFRESWILNDVISVLNGFGVRGRCEVEQNFIKNLSLNRNGIMNAHGTHAGSIFEPSGFHFGPIWRPKMLSSKPKKRHWKKSLLLFLRSGILSSLKAFPQAPSNQFGSDLERILWPFWEPKSIIEASWMAFEVVYMWSWILNDVIGVLSVFWVRGRFELKQKFIKNAFRNRSGIINAHGTPSGSIFKPSGSHFETICGPKMAMLSPKKCDRKGSWIQFLIFEMFSSFKASSEPSSNQFYTDLEPIFQPFWEPKSIIEAAWMAFEDVKLSSWVLSDVISVFNGFWVRDRFGLTQNFMKNTFPKRYRTFHAHGTPSGSIFQPSWIHFGTIWGPKMVRSRSRNRHRKNCRLQFWI